jgi:hypothetical protein
MCNVCRSAQRSALIPLTRTSSTLSKARSLSDPGECYPCIRARTGR